MISEDCHFLPARSWRKTERAPRGPPYEVEVAPGQVTRPSQAVLLLGPAAARQAISGGNGTLPGVPAASVSFPTSTSSRFSPATIVLLVEVLGLVSVAGFSVMAQRRLRARPPARDPRCRWRPLAPRAVRSYWPRTGSRPARSLPAPTSSPCGQAWPACRGADQGRPPVRPHLRGDRRVRVELDRSRRDRRRRHRARRRAARSAKRSGGEPAIPEA
jgi:hypothetical protein